MDFSGVGRWEWIGGGERTIKPVRKNRKNKNKGGVLFYVFRHKNPTNAKRKNPCSGGAALQEEPTNDQVRLVFSQTTILAPSKQASLLFFVLEVREQGGVGFCYDKVCECR